jgi:hypothetical protein
VFREHRSDLGSFLFRTLYTLNFEHFRETRKLVFIFWKLVWNYENGIVKTTKNVPKTAKELTEKFCINLPGNLPLTFSLFSAGWRLFGHFFERLWAWCCHLVRSVCGSRRRFLVLRCRQFFRRHRANVGPKAGHFLEDLLAVCQSHISVCKYHYLMRKRKLYDYFLFS